jgi:superoxide dismutase, Fe-Mn family
MSRGAAGTMAFAFLPLGYQFSDLAPAMSEQTARWHHDVVHGGYLDAINRLIAPFPDLAERSIEELMARPDAVPAEIRDDVRFSGGGHGNHQFTWKILGPRRGTAPSGSLHAKIDQTFGGFEKFVSAFKSAALALSGDGWAFLSLSSPRTAALEIVVTRGNGNVLELRKPGIMLCDLWEHAYHDDHRGDREAWIDAYLRVVDWSVCSVRYERLSVGQPAP